MSFRVAEALSFYRRSTLTDQWLRPTDPGLPYDRTHRNHAGPVALVAGIVVSVLLFANQELFTGLVPRLLPGIGDVTFLVGLLLSAGLYALLVRRTAVGTPGGTR